MIDRWEKYLSVSPRCNPWQLIAKLNMALTSRIYYSSCLRSEFGLTILFSFQQCNKIVDKINGSCLPMSRINWLQLLISAGRASSTNNRTHVPGLIIHKQQTIFLYHDNRPLARQPLPLFPYSDNLMCVRTAQTQSAWESLFSKTAWVSALFLLQWYLDSRWAGLRRCVCTLVLTG